MERYQLRYAAGIYWLLDMEQSGETYRRPVPMNECGAYIWEQLKEKKKREEIVQRVCERYGIEKHQADEDVGIFLEQLRQSQIEF